MFATASNEFWIIHTAIPVCVSCCQCSSNVSRYRVHNAIISCPSMFVPKRLNSSMHRERAWSALYVQYLYCCIFKVFKITKAGEQAKLIRKWPVITQKKNDVLYRVKKIRCLQLVDRKFVFPGRKRHGQSRGSRFRIKCATFERKVFSRERFRLTW